MTDPTASVRKISIEGSGVPYHKESRRGSEVLGRLYHDDDNLIGYPAEGTFYAVGRPNVGHLGYVRKKFLVIGDRVASESGSAPAPPPVETRVAEAEEEPIEEESLPLSVRANLDLKTPSVGTILSFIISGGGQFYAGENGKGAAILFSSIAGPVVGYSISMGDARDGELNLAPIYIGAAVSSVAWLIGVATASGDVKEHNARVLELARERRFSVSPAATQVAGEVGYGARLAIRF